MRFLGREKELGILDEQYRRESGFVVIYGRRRIDKTELVDSL